MDTPPESNYQANQPTSTQWLLIAVIAIVALCGIVLFLSGGYFLTTGFFVNRQEGATQTAIEQGSARATAASRTTELAAQATAVAKQKFDLIAEAANWPLLLSDLFSDNANEWFEGDYDDDFARITFQLDGTYTWEMQSKKGVIWRVWPRADMVTDFYLGVDARQVEENANAQYGLIFRNNDDAYFYFEVRDSQNFRVSIFRQGEWLELIPFTFTSAIHPGATNRLEVIGQGEQFYFLINAELVGETTGEYPTSGQAGLAIGLDYGDDQVEIIFDNYELRGYGVEE